MCVVLADDFTGAAEIAGVGLRYGLPSTITLGRVPDPLSGLTVIATGTRNLSASEAADVVGDLARRLPSVPGRLLFKKVDSVLRGPVLSELEALLIVAGRPRALLVPANPALGRIIHSGRYWVDDSPIDETHFRHDPEWPALSSRVEKLLHTAPGQITIAPPGAPLPDRGITVGEASSREHIAAWASTIHDDTIPAGAAEFFAEILEARQYTLHPVGTHRAASGPTLVVSGSASAPSRQAVAEFQQQGVQVVPMPRAVFQREAGEMQAVELWSEKTAALLQDRQRAVMTIGGPPAEGQSKADHLSHALAQAAASVLHRGIVRNLWVEGGGTAGALAQRMDWREFEAIDELAPGVVLLRPVRQDHPFLLLKPGSYRWPAAL